MSKLSPSVLAADALHLADAVRLAEDAGCDYLHLDIMDGVFVPNLSFGPHVVKAIDGATDMTLDTHLMIQDPLCYVDAFAKAGSDMITVHVEAEHFEECLKRIHGLGLRAGASLKPGTPASALKPYLDELELVLIMTVEPGFGGQKFMAEQAGKARELREMGFTGEISVDGGVGPDNAELLCKAGFDTLVMGTAFFTANEPKELARRVHAL